MVSSFAAGYASVGNITLIGGDTAATHITREQSQSLAATFDAVKSTTGLDIASLVQGQALGRGIADGAKASVPQD